MPAAFLDLGGRGRYKLHAWHLFELSVRSRMVRMRVRMDHH